MTWQRRIKVFLLLAGDIFIFYASLALTLVIRYAIINRDIATFISSVDVHLIPFTIIFIFWLTALWMAGLYDLAKLRNDDIFYKTLIIAFVINTAVAVAFFYFIPYFVITPKISLFIDITVTFLAFGFWRTRFNEWMQKSLRVNLVFLGAGPETIELKDYLARNPQLGYKVAAVIAPDNISELKNIFETHKVSLIVSALRFDHSERLTQILLEFLKRGANISNLDKFYETITGRVPISIIQDIWFLENIGEVQQAFYETAKRAFDILGAFILEIITLAIFPFAALAIKISYPGPIFYRQPRVGRNNKIFILTKFRSLADGINKDGEMRKPVEEEITRVGKFLRKTHIDELPQTWNILLGQMSFIGPRPEKPDFVKRLSDEIPFYGMRHLVKPGIAGWAQLNNPYAGPSVKETIEKLQYDLYYIKNRTVLLDIKILLKTLRVLLSGAGR